MPMTPEGLNALLAGEGWHYVDGVDEPAFSADFENIGSPWPALAFRYREPGMVDMVGAVHRIDSADEHVFTLPEGYRPNEQAFLYAYVHDVVAPSHEMGALVINDTGVVEVSGPSVPVDDGYVYVVGTFFLDTAAPPP